MARWRVFTGPDTRATPTAGGKVEAIDSDSFSVPGGGTQWRGAAAIGRRYRMEAGGSFASGASLATDADGRAVAAAAGDTIVARALEGSSGAGDSAWIVMLSQTDTA